MRSALTALEVRLVVGDDRHLLGQRALALFQHLSERLRHLVVADNKGTKRIPYTAQQGTKQDAG